MNLIDLLLAFVILLGLWGGWRRGFVLGDPAHGLMVSQNFRD